MDPPSKLDESREAQADSDRAINRVWREYKSTGSPALKNYLIIHYMGGHVRRIAQRLHSQLPRQVDVEDLIDEAYEGLIDVIDRFDIERNIRFETFSSPRLYGQMRDYLRDIDPAPRLVRFRSKKVQAAIESYQKIHGRAPSHDELRHHMKLSVKVFDKYMADARPATMVSFNNGAVGGGNESRGGSHAGAASNDSDAMAAFEDLNVPTPLNRAELEDLRHWVLQGFARRDRLIIVLYYYETMTMKEIGRTLGCSESRVSQRLDSILQCLRSRLNRTGAVAEFYRK